MILFELGLHFSANRVAKVHQAAFWGGVVASVYFVGLCLVCAFIRSTSLLEAVVLGCFIGISSTTMCSRDLAVRHASDTHEAEVAVGVLLVQDVTLGLMLALFPLMKLQNIVSLFGVTSKVLAIMFNLALFTIGKLKLALVVADDWLLFFLCKLNVGDL